MIEDQHLTHLMVLSVLVSKLDACRTEMRLHERVDDNLFANSMARNLPNQLACPSFLRVCIRRLLVLRVIVVHLPFHLSTST